MYWLWGSREAVTKDNPFLPRLPLPVTSSTRASSRRRIRPAVLGLVAGIVLLGLWKLGYMEPYMDRRAVVKPTKAADASAAVKEEPEIDPELLKYPVDYRVHVFYYSWYGNPEQNQKWVHWNHRVLVDNGTQYEPPGAIGSTFWPALGPYSSTAPAVVKQHFKWIRQAGIGTVCLTWWGRGESDENGERGMTDAVLPLLFKTAKETGLKISFHIEPYPGRSAQTVEKDIQDLLERFAEFGSTLEPVFYLYDSYLIASNHWASVLQPGTPLRQHPAKPVVLGLVVQQADLNAIRDAHFDGLYSYFASHSFVWGSNPANWAEINKWAASNGKIFVPSVGPGYDDERVRPWNSRNTQAREAGRYYDRGWTSIVRLGPRPKYLSITSWNEWHEGTQIEPAEAHVGDDGHRYADYKDDDDGEGSLDEVYLRRTRKWIERWSEDETVGEKKVA